MSVIAPSHQAEFGIPSRAGQDAGPPCHDAILATVAYRDIFDFPVTAFEVHRYLHDIRISREVTETCLQDLVASGVLVTDGQYIALKSRESLFALRREREMISQRLWPAGVRGGNLLASIPFVKMVAVTGSLAVNNTHDRADIDYMLVTAPDRLWTVRLIANVMRYVLRKFDDNHMCPNFFVAESSLVLKEQSLYVAQEVAQMVPVYGEASYRRLRAANTWTSRFLPNSDGAPPVEVTGRPAHPRLRRLLERLLGGRIGNWLEGWESARKLRRYNETDFLLGRYQTYFKGVTGHRRDVPRAIERAFAGRLAQVRNDGKTACILIGQAYHLAFDSKLWREMRPYPPLGALYAAGIAREDGYDVRLFDSMLATGDEDWRIALQLNRPDIVVLYEDNFNYLTKMCLSRMRDAALEMIADAVKRDATVVVCSSDASDHPELYLAAGADYVICGEGEATMSAILAAIDKGADAASIGEIAGLAFNDAQGELVYTKPRALIRRLDQMPTPAWDLVDVARYREIWARRHGHFSVNMVTTRGCPYHCNWCAKPIWGQAYTARSPQHVVDELVQLVEKFGAEYVWFMDDIFGLKPGWIARFAELRAANSLTVPFKCLSRPDLLLRDGEIAALADAGCDIVWMGAESGSQKILDAMEKGTSTEQIRLACQGLRDAGVRLGLFIQFGYPGETKRDIWKTIELIREVLPDEMGISVSYPLPGTKFFDRVRDQLGKKQNWVDSDDLAMLYRGPYRGVFYRALYNYVHRDRAIRWAWRSMKSEDDRRRLGHRRTLRRAAGILANTMLRGFYRLEMELSALLPNRGVASVAPELARDSAGTPTRQIGD